MRKARIDAEVVIVGGGAAGIAAALRLREADVSARILEARTRLGGRAWTVATPANLPIDLGCGWLHSADRNPWHEIAEAQGRTIDKAPPPWNRPSIGPDFSPREQEDFRRALKSCHERLAAAADESLPDLPASEFLESSCRWNARIGAISTYISGAELERVSARDLARYEDSGVNWRVAEGYGATIATHGADLPATLGCIVRRIDHSHPRLRLETNAGRISADAVIVTLPTSAIDEALFHPALPQKAEAALGLPLGYADKLFLALADAEEFEPDSSLFGRKDSAATAAYHVRPFGRPLIEAYFGGSLARELERGGKDAFADFAAKELAAALGNDFPCRIKPLAIHCWGADPFAGGAYSCALPGRSECRGALAAPVDDRIFFAGEACSRSDYSTAHGAYLSGIAAAEQLLRCRETASADARPR